jgi:hypothetical protein
MIDKNILTKKIDNAEKYTEWYINNVEYDPYRILTSPTMEDKCYIAYCNFLSAIRNAMDDCTKGTTFKIQTFN